MIITDWLWAYSIACLGMKLDLDIYCLDKYHSLCTTELIDKISLEQTFAYGRTYEMI